MYLKGMIVMNSTNSFQRLKRVSGVHFAIETRVPCFTANKFKLKPCSLLWTVWQN